MHIYRLSAENNDEAVKAAADALAKGGIVLFPTDTLYGLAVSALDEKAVEKLRAVKGRERKKPISVIVPSLEHMYEHAELHPEARMLAEAHLPGALTLVVPARPHLPEDLQLNGTIGIRIPNDPFALALAKAFGKPYTATSANKAGYQTPATVDKIIEQLGSMSGHLTVVIDAGERAGNTPSTVVGFIDGTPRILREGAISREDLGIQ